MTTIHVLAADAFVPTPTGPTIACRVGVSTGAMVINRHGRVTASEVVGTHAIHVRPMVSLLTDAGEFTFDERAVLSTRRGRMFAIDVARQIRSSGPQVRIEMARTAELPPGKPPQDSGATRAMLACLDPPVIRIPGHLRLATAVEQLLTLADVSFVDVSDGRWTAFAYDNVGLDHHNVPPSVADLALLTLTAWTQVGDIPISRSTLEQSAVRRRLLAALACAGTPGQVRWLPGYRPVEARVSPGAPRPYAVAKTGFVHSASAVEIELADEGSVVSDLAIVAAGRATRT